MESQTKGRHEANISVTNTSLKTLDDLGYHKQFDNTSIYSNVSNTSALPSYTNYDFAVLILSQPENITQILIGFLGVSINLLCMMALFQVTDKWTSHFQIMLSLMFADLLTAASDVTLVLFYAFAFYFIEVTTSTYIGRCINVIYGFVVTGLNATLLSLTCMAMDHYVTIMYPWRSPVSTKKCGFAIIIIWLIAAMTGFSDFFAPVRDNKAQYTTFAIGFICGLVMMSLYLSIYHTAKKSGKLVAMAKTDGRISFINQKNMKALVTTSIILGTFILFWLPIGCINFIIHFDTRPQAYDVHEIRDHFHGICMCLLLLNTVCDPIIYAIRIRHVRKGILMLLSKIASKRLKHRFTDPQSCLNYRKYDFD